MSERRDVGLRERFTTDRKGFTLVELLIVVGILVIMSVVLVPIGNRMIQRSREAQDYANIMTIYDALQLAVQEDTVQVNQGYVTYNATGILSGLGATSSEQMLVFFPKGARMNSGADKTGFDTKIRLTSKLYTRPANLPKFYFYYSGGGNGSSGIGSIIVTYENPVKPTGTS